MPRNESPHRESASAFIPIADPVGRLTDRAVLWHRALDLAPDAPRCLATVLVRLVHDRCVPADALLIAADALEDAAQAALLDGQIGLSAQLHRLAELPRERAPARARREA